MRISTPAVGFVKYSDFVLTGDLLTKGAALVETLQAGDAGTYLQGKGATTKPAYEKTMPPLTMKGDILAQGFPLPIRIAAQATGKVLTSTDIGEVPVWKSLFDVLTSKGDLWLWSGSEVAQRAAGALNTYFKGQGAAQYPDYSKLALRDTGVKIDDDFRGTAGNQVITGVGFKPSIILFYAVDLLGANLNLSWGAATADNAMCIHLSEAASVNGLSASNCIIVRTDISNLITAVLASMDADGFTLTWTLTGSQTAKYIYIALP